MMLWAVTCPAQLPTELYALHWLAWDGPGTNFQVLVRTQTNALPITVIQSTNRATIVSNLQYGQTYFLAVKAQSGGQWSGESTNYTWPHKREDYFTTMNYSLASPQGAKFWLPTTLRTVTNSSAPSQYVGVAAWASNNITPFIRPQ